MNRLTDEEKRLKLKQYGKEYMKNYRLKYPDYDKTQRSKPGYHEREKTRLRNRYWIVKKNEGI